MSIVASRVTAGTSATLLASNPSAAGESSDYALISFALKNVDGTASVFLGPAGVTTANGFEWEPSDGPMSIDLEPGESLYGIVSADDQLIHIMRQGR